MAAAATAEETKGKEGNGRVAVRGENQPAIKSVIIARLRNVGVKSGDFWMC